MINIHSSLTSQTTIKYLTGTYRPSRPTPVANRFKHHQRSSIAVKIEQKRLVYGVPPQTPPVELTALPRPPSWWGVGQPPSHPKKPSRLGVRPRLSAPWASSNCCPYSKILGTPLIELQSQLIKAKFHYASWFGAGSKLVRTR